MMTEETDTHSLSTEGVPTFLAVIGMVTRVVRGGQKQVRRASN
jgi:hypothetical protein